MAELSAENKRLAHAHTIPGWEFYVEKMALAIQSSTEAETARKCAEIAEQEYRATEKLNETHHEGASVELNCAASSCTAIWKAILAHYGLEEKQR